MHYSLKRHEVSIYIASPQSRFGYKSTAGMPDPVNTVLIYKAPQSKEEIMNRRYGTKRLDANEQDED